MYVSATATIKSGQSQIKAKANQAKPRGINAKPVKMKESQRVANTRHFDFLTGRFLLDAGGGVHELGGKNYA